MVTVCTGWHPAAWSEYAKNFVDSFDFYWPKDISILAYTETPVDVGTRARKIEIRSLWDCDGAKLFFDRHRRNRQAQGQEPNDKWRDKHRKRGYNFRFDAYKFFKQLMIPEHAAIGLPDGEILVWFDADVVTFAGIDPGFIEGLIGDADLVHLGRRGTHSEIGFWAVRLNDRSRRFLTCLAETYRSDRVFKLSEWHSAFVFDRCRETQTKTDGLISRDLTPGGHGHVWFQSPLGTCTDHVKGNRKKLGRSPERPK